MTPTDKMRTRAVEYVVNGWPVAPLAVPLNDRCPCERGDCLEPHLITSSLRPDAPPGLTDPADVADIWAENGWGIALVTSAFDVIDLPARMGANLNHKLLTSCPTATAPRGRRWHFVLERGSLPADLLDGVGGRLHSGATDWIAASPTRTEATGRIGWVVEPHMTRWQPYKRRDAMDLVFGRFSTRETGQGLPTVLTEGG